MVQSKIKTVLFAIFLSLFTFSLLSANDLSSKYLTKADEALEAENIADAYKYINASLATEKDKLDHSKIIYLAQTIYILKLKAQFEKAVSHDEYEVARSAYEEISRLLNPHNILREVMKIQMVGMGYDSVDETK